MMNMMNGAANYNNTINPVTGGNIAKENLIRDINNGVDPDAIKEEKNNDSNKEDDKPKSKPLRAEIEPMEFDSFGETLRIDSRTLAEQISAMFKAIFFDYFGTTVRYENGNFSVQLYFKNNGKPKDSGDPRIKSVIDLTSSDNDDNNNDNVSFFDKKRIINNRLSAKLYDLNDETKEFLSEFLYGGAKANKPNNKKAWAQKLTDVRAPLNDSYIAMYNNGYRAEEVALRVTGVNIYKILKKLYGDKMIAHSGFNDSTMVPCDYEVRFVKFNYVNSELPVFTMHIERYDIDKVNKYVATEYPWKSFTGTPIVCY